MLGAEHVEKSWAAADDFNLPMQGSATEYCWGAIWSRDHLTRAQRSMLNIGMLAPLNRRTSSKVHVTGALRNGVTVEQIRGILMQVAVYGGMPAALDSFRIASEAIKAGPWRSLAQAAAAASDMGMHLAPTAWHRQ